MRLERFRFHLIHLSNGCAFRPAHQGSEYDAVVVALHTQHYRMLQRNLLYTAITRAKGLVVLVGTRRAVGIAARNDKVRKRHSGLRVQLERQL